MLPEICFDLAFGFVVFALLLRLELAQPYETYKFIGQSFMSDQLQVL